MILLYKPLGQTPLQAINELRKRKNELEGRKLSYAGRLDPMAEGLLLVLVDEENKKRRSFESLDKEYEFEAIIGIRTDSYDLLGIPEVGENTKADPLNVSSFIKKNLKTITQAYPPYSAGKVGGKPLYWWTRQKKKVSLPKKEVNIKNLEVVDSHFITGGQLFEEVVFRINLVSGDFRQEEIKEAWKKELGKFRRKKFQVLRFKLSCSSGAYVRSLVNDLGQYLKSGATTYSIKRTRISSFSINSSVRID